MKYIDWIKNFKQDDPSPTYSSEFNGSRNCDDQSTYNKTQKFFSSDIEEQEKKNKRSDLADRMIKSYNKNKSRINGNPENSEPSQSEKRRKKLSDLTSRSSSWKGLETYINNARNDLVQSE